MASKVARSRLLKELANIRRKPIENIQAAPLETNILRWHFVILGPNDSPYSGGVYHGVLIFPSEYPYKPPGIMLFTPSGRFKTSTRICLSMSDFHPESWNPMWSVSTILVGVLSFMLEDKPTVGSIVSSDAEKRRLAAKSLARNMKDKHFRELFPELVQRHEEQERIRQEALAELRASRGIAAGGTSEEAGGTSQTAGAAGGKDDDNTDTNMSTSPLMGLMIIAFLVCVVGVLVELVRSTL